MVPEKPYFLNSPKRLLASYKLEWEDDDIQALLVHHPDLQGTAPPPPPQGCVSMDWFALAAQREQESSSAETWLDHNIQVT